MKIVWCCFAGISLCVVSAGSIQAQREYVVPGDDPPEFLQRGDELTLLPGGELPHGAVAALESTINIMGGVVRGRLMAGRSSVINIRGGVLEPDFELSGDYLPVRLLNWSAVNVHGGAIADGFAVVGFPSLVALYGSEFRINGVPVEGLDEVGDGVQIHSKNSKEFITLEGVFEDGSPFLFTRSDDSIFYDEFDLLEREVAQWPAYVEIDGATELRGAQPGQRINVLPGGVLPNNFTVGRGGSLEITGGAIGNNLEIVGGQITAKDSTIGADIDLFYGAEVSIANGSLGANAVVHGDSVLTVVDSSAEDVSVSEGSELRVYGGSVGGLEIVASKLEVGDGEFNSEVEVGSSSTVTIRGGLFQDDVSIYSSQSVISGGRFDGFLLVGGGALSLVGRAFALNGTPIAGLEVAGDEIVISERDGAVLSGRFDDGSSFEFELFETSRLPDDSRFGFGPRVRDSFSADTTLRLVVAVPEPASVGLLLAAVCGVGLTMRPPTRGVMRRTMRRAG